MFEKLQTEFGLVNGFIGALQPHSARYTLNPVIFVVISSLETASSGGRSPPLSSRSIPAHQSQLTSTQLLLYPEDSLYGESLLPTQEGSPSTSQLLPN
jgi:hypothetical protein